MHSPASQPSGLYIHIPFCRTKCRYCGFTSFPDLLKEIPLYLKTLNLEMQNYRNSVIDTLFIGGGTPTTLSAEEWCILFISLRENFIFSENLEATVECNPESLSEEKLILFKKNGINRLSFGLQSTHNQILKKLGRCHDFEQFKKMFQKAQSLGFKNLNVDLIYGIPEQSLSDWNETIHRMIEFFPKHISTYALGIEENTVFYSEQIKIDPELQAEMYETASDVLQKSGYSHYEISNFSKPGYECRHNLRYWKNLPAIGLGVSAAGYKNGTRTKNSEKFHHYVESIINGASPVIEKISLSESERIGEDLMLSLRLKEGSDMTLEIQKFYGNVLQKYEASGLLEFSSEKKRVRMTQKGWLLSNQIFQELLSPSDTITPVALIS